ncbi:MAG: peptidyl-prolyl cis-trans isomerase [bacterium]
MYIRFILFLIVFIGCVENEHEPNFVARVGVSSLTEEDLALASVFTDKERFSYVDNWIRTELLYQAGSEVDLDKDLLIETKIKRYKKKLVGQTFLDTKIQDAVFVSKDEIRNYYRKNKEQFRRLKSEATINSFVLTDKKEAARVRANLEKSTNNKKRVEMFNKHTVLAETFADGMLHSKVNNKVFGPKKLKYIGPISLGNKYSVIEVVKRYEKGTYFGLDRVYDKIYSLIYKRKAAIRTQTIIDSLKQEIALEIKTNKT